MDSIIIGSSVFVEGKLQSAIVGIKDGKIAFIEINPTPQTKENVVSRNAGAKITEVPNECVVLPGLVDSHVHVNDPGRTDWEGFDSATAAAAVGGVTTIADMPLNSIPPTTNVPNLQMKLDTANDRCWCDVRFIGGAVHDNAEDIQPLLDAGVCGFKCFLINSGVPEFTHVNEEQARLALSKIQGSNGFLMYHAELEIDHHDQVKEDPKLYNTFLKSRPKEMEDTAIDLVVRMCRDTKVKSHIVHLSSCDPIDQIRQAKEEGLPLTVETCYHYLFFDSETIPDAKPQFKCCPPIREHNNREILWQALQDGVIDMVVSDHSPCTANLKQVNGGDYMESWGGISSLQYGLSILYTECRKRSIGFDKIVKWISEEPAKLIGLSHKKSKIAIGYDADFVIFNPNKSFLVNTDDIKFKNKLTAYEGIELQGVVEKTILRGEVIAENGNVVTSTNHFGNLITRV